IFNSLDAKGTWTLQVSDVAAQDQGTHKSWSLTITGTPGVAAPAALKGSGDLVGVTMSSGFVDLKAGAAGSVSTSTTALFAPAGRPVSISSDVPIAPTSPTASIAASVTLPTALHETTSTPSVYL